MGQPCQADKLLEVLGNKLRPVVGNNPRESTRISFSSSLQDDLDVELRHRGAQFPMQQETQNSHPRPSTDRRRCRQCSDKRYPHASAHEAQVAVGSRYPCPMALGSSAAKAQRL